HWSIRVASACLGSADAGISGVPISDVDPGHYYLDDGVGFSDRSRNAFTTVYANCSRVYPVAISDRLVARRGRHATYVADNRAPIRCLRGKMVGFDRHDGRYHHNIYVVPDITGNHVCLSVDCLCHSDGRARFGIDAGDDLRAEPIALQVVFPWLGHGQYA